MRRSELTRLAKMGAEAELRGLTDRAARLHRMFPELRRTSTSTARATASDTGQQRRRRGWTKAQRDAAAKRMRAYWKGRKRTG